MTDETIPVLDPVPTQVAFPARTLLRTIVQNLVGMLVALVARKYGYDLTPYSADLVNFLTVLTWTAVTTFTTWVMTRPWVVKLLAGTILAPAPAVTKG